MQRYVNESDERGAYPHRGRKLRRSHVIVFLGALFNLKKTSGNYAENLGRVSDSTVDGSLEEGWKSGMWQCRVVDRRDFRVRRELSCTLYGKQEIRAKWGSVGKEVDI